MSRRKVGLLALEVLVPVGVVVLWWWASRASTSLYFPPLSEVLGRFRANWLFDRVGEDLAPSLARLTVGYVLAVLAGVGLGAALAAVPLLRELAGPIVTFLRAIPPPALLPFAILLFGIGDTMKIFIIAFVCVWPILLNALDGFVATEPTMLDTTRVYGIGGARRLWRIMLPNASPRIFAGMRTSLSLAIIIMVISEMVASTNGAGYFVLQAQRNFAIADMWSGIILLGLLGYVLNVAFLLLERRALRWYLAAQRATT
jgi:ABC-type nitrate/sulfonate/bicarbonate transport system permease component